MQIYRTGLAPEWIDYNGHLRDAFYGLIVSYASDALMDRLGMDAAYRERTHNTLYTLEMHTHFFHEVKQSDSVFVNVRILGADPKRIHAAFDIVRDTGAVVAASIEMMLLHVHQGATPASAPFPPEIASAVTKLAAATASAQEVGPGSRRMELPRRQ
jgi:acyl-CoA thioester hydrolase